ncbi:MAG: hypothetical protein ACYCW6_28905 [Candidatus Xenobia bacterium]
MLYIAQKLQPGQQGPQPVAAMGIREHGGTHLSVQFEPARVGIQGHAAGGQIPGNAFDFVR